MGFIQTEAVSAVTDRELRELASETLQTMLARRVGSRDRFSMLRDLRCELEQTLTHAPVTENSLHALSFRARLAIACREEISRLEAEVTAMCQHMPGIRR